MNTERIISEEEETNLDLETTPQNKEPEIQSQNDIDYQNIQDINQSSKCQENGCCICCHRFFFLLFNSLIIVSTVFEFMATAECRVQVTIFDIFVDTSFLITFALILIYICKRKENILKASTFYILFTLFWALPSLLYSFLTAERSYYIGIYYALKSGKLFLIFLSFIINLAFIGAKNCR